MVKKSTNKIKCSIHNSTYGYDHGSKFAVKGMNKLAASIHGGEDAARSQVDRKKNQEAPVKIS